MYRREWAELEENVLFEGDVSEEMREMGARLVRLASIVLALAHCMTAEAQAAQLQSFPNTVVLRMLVGARRALSI